MHPGAVSHPRAIPASSDFLGPAAPAVLAAVGLEDDLWRALELRIEVGLELRLVEAFELDLGRHAQKVQLLEDPRGDVATEEPKWEEDHHPVELPSERRVDVVQARRVAGREEPDGERTPEPADAVHRHCTDRIVDSKLLLDEVPGVHRERSAEHGDQ